MSMTQKLFAFFKFSLNPFSFEQYYRLSEGLTHLTFNVVREGGEWALKLSLNWFALIMYCLTGDLNRTNPLLQKNMTVGKYLEFSRC